MQTFFVHIINKQRGDFMWDWIYTNIVNTATFPLSTTLTLIVLVGTHALLSLEKQK